MLTAHLDLLTLLVSNKDHENRLEVNGQEHTLLSVWKQTILKYHQIKEFNTNLER